MANQNIFDEYLVKLGFSTDQVGYTRFANALRDAGSLVDNQYLRMGKRVAAFEATTLGMFAAVGTGAIKLFDDVAMADQQYRLLALHMYTSLPVARELKIALDALGQPLENIMWDPELAARFHQLIKDQQTMTKELGPEFEKQMLRIRDVRFEFTRFGVELKYLTMFVVEDLAKAFGTNIEGMLEKMRNLNDYIISHLPEIANWITSKLQPVLVDVYNVFISIWHAIEKIGPELAKINWVKFIEDISKAVIALVRLEQNLALMFAAAGEAIHGNYKEALKDLGKMDTLTGPSKTGPMAAVPAVPLASTAPGMATPANVKAAIIQQARALGVPPELALSVAQVESNFRQFDKSGNVLRSNVPGSHATGIFQLQPGTAKELGVNPEDTGENILGGVKYLQRLLNKYGNAATALEHYYGSRIASENQAYARKVIAGESAFSGDINVTVNAQTNASAQDIARETAKAVKESQQKQTQRNLAEFQNPGWSY